MNNEEEDLKLIIEALRQKLISVGMSKGFLSPETIKLGEALDKVLNLYFYRKNIK